MIRAGLLSAFLLIAAGPLAADGDDQTPLAPIAFLRQHDARVQELLAAEADSLSSQTRLQVKEMINGVFDFTELSRRALGPHWTQRSEDERRRFVETFSAIIAEKNFDSFVRYYRDGSIDYRDETLEGAAAAVTAVVPIKDRDETVGLVYHLHRIDDQWRIYDLVIDEASTVKGYQRQYARFLKKRTYEQLLERLDRQLAQLQK